MREPGKRPAAVPDRRLLRHPDANRSLEAPWGRAAGPRTSPGSRSRSPCGAVGTPAGSFDSSACAPRSAHAPARRGRPGAPRVSSCGDGLWRTRFGGDPRSWERPDPQRGALHGDRRPAARFLFLGVGSATRGAVLETDRARARELGVPAARRRIAARRRPRRANAGSRRRRRALRSAYPDTNAGRGVRVQPLAELVSGTTGHAPRPPGRGGARSADRLHQPRQSPAVRPRRGPRPRAGPPHGARSGPNATSPACSTETAVLALPGGVLGLLVAYGVLRLLSLGPARLLAPRKSASTCRSSRSTRPLHRGRSRPRCGSGAPGQRPAYHRGNGVHGRGTPGARDGREAARCSLPPKSGSPSSSSSGRGFCCGRSTGSKKRIPGSARTTPRGPAFAAEGPLGTPEAISRYADQATDRLAKDSGSRAGLRGVARPPDQWRATSPT